MHADGASAVPGFVDAHTHLPFAGDRVADLERRLAGASYKEILDAGGGIHTTMSATRRASESELEDLCRGRLDLMLLHGTTTVEAKSGYGMETATEVRQLRALHAAAARHPVTCHATFMGAHVMPAEHGADRAGYLRLVTEEMLPLVRRQRLAEAVDVFCEEGVYSIAESRLVLEKARALGFALRIHAEELVTLGGAELAAELGAASADHLVHVSERGMAMMADAGVAAVLLPATTFFLKGTRYAPARRMVELGVAVALATDLNPGSSHTHSLANVLALGCFELSLSMPEALAACTLNGAYALRSHAKVGSIEPGKVADMLLLAVPDYRHLVYAWGINHVRTVIKRGRVVVEEGRRVPAVAA